MLFLAPIILILPSLSVVGAVLQNITVDDTSPDIVYGSKTFQCTAANGCIDPERGALYNNSATFTNGSITFRFPGVAYYADIDVLGTANVELDGVQQGTTLGSPSGAVMYPVSQTGLTNGTHTLTIQPISGAIIAFDSLIYTASFPDPPKNKKSHAGAIAGGVVGGLAVVFGVVLAGLFAHRKKLILRRNQRKSAVLRGMDAARRNQGEVVAPGEEDAKVVPAM